MNGDELDPSLFADTPAPTGGNHLDPSLFSSDPAPESKPLLPQIAKGALGDIAGNAKTSRDAILGALGLPGDIATTATQMLTQKTPLADTPLGADADTINKFGAAAPAGFKQSAKDLVTKQGWINHPVNNALLVSGLRGALKGFGGEGIPSVADDGITHFAPSTDSASVPMEAVANGSAKAPRIVSNDPKFDVVSPSDDAPAPSAAPAATDPLKTFTDAIPQTVTDKAKELKDYLSRKYDEQSAKPGFTNEVADWLHRKSQVMAVKQLGASPMQARQLGDDATRALGQYALDKGIVSPSVGLKGMRDITTGINSKAGQTIGALRDLADQTRNPQTDPIDVLQEVRNRLDSKYARGVNSGEQGSYLKSLQDVEDSEPTFSGAADVATKLNQAANQANRLNQPHSAYTDVANAISDINNERIKNILGPQKAAIYDQALKDFGATKKIGQFLTRKESREVAGRMGPGSFVRDAAQEAMDGVGYKAGARVANKMSGAVLKNPSIARSLPSLFKEFINQVEDIGGDDSPHMNQGGVVPNQDDHLKSYLVGKYGPKK